MWLLKNTERILTRYYEVARVFWLAASWLQMESSYVVAKVYKDNFNTLL